jgi:preprotein translocase subunit SecG
MATAFYIAQILVSVMLIVLVIAQARTPGMANQDSSSMQHSRRGLEKTMHQTTIALAVIFLLLALVNSLPVIN